MEESQSHTKKAGKQYGQLKKDDLQWDNWLTQVVEAQVEAKIQMTDAVWKQIQSTEAHCMTG